MTERVRAERRAMIALVTVFALLVQALVPALANASPVRPDEQVICTERGLSTVKSGDAAPANQPRHGTCDHCLCTPPLADIPRALGFAILRPSPAREASVAVAVGPSPPVRAPPRPPGQGPPRSDA